MDAEISVLDQALKDRIRRRLSQNPWSEPQREAIRHLTDEIQKLQVVLGRFPTTAELAAKMQFTYAGFMSYLNELQLLFQFKDDDLPGSIHILESLATASTESCETTKAQLIGGLASALRTLPDLERLFVGLFYYEELSLKEIGTMTGVPYSEVTRIVAQGITKLIATDVLR